MNHTFPVLVVYVSDKVMSRPSSSPTQSSIGDSQLPTENDKKDHGLPLIGYWSDGLWFWLPSVGEPASQSGK